jgi:replicative DNA helicase
MIDDAAAVAEEAMVALREALAMAGIEAEAGQGPRWGQPGKDDGEEHGEDGEESPSVRELIGGYWDYVEKRQQCAGTGLGKLDQALMGGLEAGRLYIILGAPGSGKTTLANQIADWLAADHPVFFVSAEEKLYHLLCKSLSRRSGVEYHTLLQGYQTERPRIQMALEEYESSSQGNNLRYFDATSGRGGYLQRIVERAIEHFEECSRRGYNKFPVLVLDYLQRLTRMEDIYIRAMTGGAGALGADARLAATVYIERLSELAKKFGWALIAISAMNRSGGYSTAVDRSLNAAKESGDIEYAADFVASLGPDPDSDGSINLVEPGTFAWRLTIAKNRQGLTSLTGADIPLRWVPAYQRFDQRERVPDEPLADDQEEDRGQGRRSQRRARGRESRSRRRS